MSVSPRIAPHRKVLPQWVAPLKLAAQSTILEGAIPLARMPRLSEAVLAIDVPISASLHFYRDESGYRVVEGDVSTQVQLLCQRCMKPVMKMVSARVGWIIVLDEEKISSLPKRYEPWILDNTDADLHEAIEEEFLLALPIVGFHDPDECESDTTYSTGETGISNISKRPNPFDVLQGLDFKKH